MKLVFDIWNLNFNSKKTLSFVCEGLVINISYECVVEPYPSLSKKHGQNHLYRKKHLTINLKYEF